MPSPEYAPSNLRVGWNVVTGSHQGGVSQKSSSRQCRFRSGHVVGGLSTNRWHPLVGCRGEGLTRGIMVAVPPALALKPHNSGTFRLWHFASCCSSSRAQGECLRVSDSVCGPFKGMFGFPAAFHLTWTGRIRADFYTQILWELLFLALKPFLGSPSVGLGPSATMIALPMLNHHTLVQC